MSLALFFLDRAQFFDSSINLVNRLAVKPVTSLTITAADKLKFIFKGVFTVRNLVKENWVLKNERDFFRAESIKLQQVAEENEFLRQALSLESKESRRPVVANILAYDPFQASDFFTLDKGARQGVRVNDPVVLGGSSATLGAGNILVGRVKEVGDKDSRVLLVSSSQSRITASSRAVKTLGVVTGSASGALTLDLVLKDIELAAGQILLTSGLDGIFPAGLLIGEVERIFGGDGSSFKKALVRPFFSPRDLKQVFVLISP
ncbi:MAG: rod shape-determining protein MreC [Parcubacteria group bacterium]|nr:rod shape-determining protein MreC [Parcubacteria group bacterium]